MQAPPHFAKGKDIFVVQNRRVAQDFSTNARDVSRICLMGAQPLVFHWFITVLFIRIWYPIYGDACKIHDLHESIPDPHFDWLASGVFDIPIEELIARQYKTMQNQKKTQIPKFAWWIFPKETNDLSSGLATDWCKGAAPAAGRDGGSCFATCRNGAFHHGDTTTHRIGWGFLLTGKPYIS